MIFSWLNGREAAEIGSTLADEFAPRAPSTQQGLHHGDNPDWVEELLRRADSQARPLQLNFYKKAKLANSFKWRLIEHGVAHHVADEVTQSLVMHLSQNKSEAVEAQTSAAGHPADRAKAQQLFLRGNRCIDRGTHAEAAALFEEVVRLDPSHAEAFNNRGSSLTHLGQYDEAENCFREAIAIRPSFPDPHGNLGNLLRMRAKLNAAELSLRHALRLKPNFEEARINLGLTLTFAGRARDARACFAKVLKRAPANLQALQGMGQLAALEGRFPEAESIFNRMIEIDPKAPSAWAALAGLRRMTSADREWFIHAQEIADSAIHPLDEANLRFAMGKYCDDIGSFSQAFENFKRGNEILKLAAERYDRRARTGLIDDLIRVYSRREVEKIVCDDSSSQKPVFVVGMPRSGTSLAEQIIASHPQVHGAGELQFWEPLVLEQAETELSVLTEPARAKTLQAYLSVLHKQSGSALRVVDKAPANADFLGVIYSVFPRARVIHMERDPIDTCLSCYFQQFLLGLNFTFDLSDLVHYYRERQRIMAHWRSVLPPGFMLEVRYEDLVADHERWSRRMLEFIGLPWDPRCLEFQATERRVVTASAWQVRQKVYQSSVGRWRNYEKFIGPLQVLGTH